MGKIGKIKNLSSSITKLALLISVIAFMFLVNASDSLAQEFDAEEFPRSDIGERDVIFVSPSVLNAGFNNGSGGNDNGVGGGLVSFDAGGISNVGSTGIVVVENNGSTLTNTNIPLHTPAIGVLQPGGVVSVDSIVAISPGSVASGVVGGGTGIEIRVGLNIEELKQKRKESGNMIYDIYSDDVELAELMNEEF